MAWNKVVSFSVILIELMFLSCSERQAEKLIVAISQGNYSEVENLLDTGILKHIDDMSVNPMLLAIQKKDDYLIKLLVLHGASPNIILEDDASLLQLAVRAEDYSMIEFLMQNGASVNYTAPDGTTVFSSAIASLPDEYLSSFVKNSVDLMGGAPSGGSDLNTGTPLKMSYFEYCLLYKKTKTAGVLLNNPDILHQVLSDKSMLLKLIYYWTDGSRQLADALVAHGYTIDTNLPLLQEAISIYDAVEWLLEHGFSPNRSYNDPSDSFNNGTPIEVAQRAKRRFGMFDEDDSAKTEIEQLDKVIKLLEEFARAN